MSSPGSPTLNIDVSARRAERVLATAILMAVVAAVSLLQQPIAIVATVALCAAVSIGGGFHLIGWIGGPNRLTRIACDPDGHWFLSDAGGRTIEVVLSGTSRVTSSALWLEWVGRKGRPLLLLPDDVSSVAFRRLVVRLRLGDRQISGASPDVS
jgi:hypothetical protein